MGINQRDVTRNQSSLDITFKRLFVGNNAFQEGIFLNNTGGDVSIETGTLVARNSGTYETASMAFSATPLSAGQTVIIAGLTFTSTGATTQAQLAQAFANLADGATSGSGTGLGTYSGALTGYKTGGVVGNAVLFTASTTGNKTNLAATGTGALPVATITAGTAGVANGLVPVTLANVVDVVGILLMEDNEPVTVATTTTLNVNYGLHGDVDETNIVLPEGMTLDTVPSGTTKTVRDILNALGFHLEFYTSTTKFDN